MGGCTSQPKVLKGDESDIPPPILKEDADANDAGAAAKDDETKHQSLGFLFENDPQQGSNETATTGETFEPGIALEVPDAKPLQGLISVKSPETVADHAPVKSESDKIAPETGALKPETGNEKKEDIGKAATESSEAETCNKTITEEKQGTYEKVEMGEEKKPEEKALQESSKSSRADEINCFANETQTKIDEKPVETPKTEKAEVKTIEDKVAKKTEA